MAALAVKKLPEGDEWLYELKWDGYRALLIKDGEDVQIRSRNDKDLTSTYPGTATAGRAPEDQADRAPRGAPRARRGRPAVVAGPAASKLRSKAPGDTVTLFDPARQNARNLRKQSRLSHCFYLPGSPDGRR